MDKNSTTNLMEQPSQIELEVMSSRMSRINKIMYNSKISVDELQGSNSNLINLDFNNKAKSQTRTSCICPKTSSRCPDGECQTRQMK